MKAYEMTLKQYQNMKLEEYKNTNYWNKALKLKKELRDNILSSKMEKWKNEWHDLIVEYGKNNRLTNKVIYSFNREYGRKYLLYVFRCTDKALQGWINSDAIGL